MHRASDTLRALYGLGGLADARFNFVLDPDLVASNDDLNLVMAKFNADAISASNTPDPTNPAQVNAQTAAVCECALAKAMEAFQLPPDQLAALQQTCLSDTPTFLTALDQQANAAGQPIDAVGCMANPGGVGGSGGNGGSGQWYRNPWVLGGGALLLGAAAWVALR